MSAALTPVRRAWAFAICALVVLCLAYTPEIGSAVATWNASTAYGHCWLVLPIVLWLLWERRRVVQACIPSPSAWPVLAAIPLMLLWLAANWLGLMEGRQLALIGLAELLLIAALGWRLWWSLSPAFLYLLFLVPFGAFLTPALQRFTTGFILAGLRFLDVPFDSDAFQITIPEGVFYVAEACAGLRFLIASVAFGVLYAVTMFRSPWRRAIFIAVSCVVPVIANGIRGLGIVLLGHVLGSAEAGAADHLIYGWVFFSFVIVLLALSGLPFRQDQPVEVPEVHESLAGPHTLAMLKACVPILAVACAGPIAVHAMNARTYVATATIVPEITVPVSCRAAMASVIGAVSTQNYLCPAGEIRVTATTLPPGSNPARILDAARFPVTSGLVGNVDTQPWRTPAGDFWMLVIAHESPRQGAFAAVIDHRLLLSGLHDRLQMARSMLGNGQGPAVAISVSLESADPGALDQLRAFLSVQTGIRAAVLF